MSLDPKMWKTKGTGVLWFLVLTHLATISSSSSLEALVYVGCTQLKYSPGTPYESNVNSVLTSLVNSASISNFNTFKIFLPGSTQSDVVYGLFQCRGDLSRSDCHYCVGAAVSRVSTYCVGTSGAALQLEGCFVKYDNVSFLGGEDKSPMSNKCGPGESELWSGRDGVLAYLERSGGGQYFRVGGSGKVQGMGQCIEDLSREECQDCLSEAIQRLKTQCPPTSPWGDIFLAKCYARYYSSSSSFNAHRLIITPLPLYILLSFIYGVVS